MKEVFKNVNKVDSGRWEKVWLTRWNQKLDESMTMLASIQSDLGWDKVDESLLEFNQEQILDCTEAILLKASHLRAKNQRQKSGALIAKVYRFYTKHDIPLCFRLTFELGLDYYINEDYNEALEYFLIAEQKAKSPCEKIFTLSNLLWCLEALDLQRSRYEEHLSKAINQLDKEKPFFIHVIEQYSAYKQRQGFYKGSFNKSSLQTKYSQLSQSTFFNLWVGSLPYIKCFEPISVDRLVSTFNTEYMWQGSYRYRTLAGLCIPSDSHQVRVPDAIDRLYLWTWCFLDEQKCISLEKLSLTLSSIIEQLEFDKLAVENKLLLRNALKWLSLFVPKLTSRYQSIYDYNLDETSFMLLEQEYLYICSLEKNDLSFSVNKYGFVEVEQKVSLIKKYIEDNENRVLESDSYNIEVNIGRGTVNVLDVSKTIKSDILSLFFYELSSDRSVMINNLGVNFEADRRKVYNLVARVKKILPEHKIEILGQSISIIGPKKINIKQIGINVKPINSLSQKNILDININHGLNIPVEATKLAFPNGFKRQNLEKSYKSSKSSVTRVINDWLSKSIVIKKNKGKATLYIWSNK